ncbi:low molecular weight phosphatase family protein [Breoghania sp. L-A4]|uniref:arsenate-mycothiol transferase ArsC n=1 Tax=Breoghania sp. L-A4 TaxID=2304600 RepID=UPI000E35E017|nr:low molecular weight phosphatase family protein [Breoghania sp. L-A4]AXS39032.1 low molecular weight phosphatase family protein [Breoghania sp. L-A4]
MSQKTILFVCPDNAVLGPMAEACMNAAGKGRVRAFSAGRMPADRLHPGVDRLLRREGFQTDVLAPKSWDIFALPHAPAVDMVIALSEEVDGDHQPCWTGAPRHCLWEVADAASAALPVDEQFRRIRLAVQRFLANPQSA